MQLCGPSLCLLLVSKCANGPHCQVSWLIIEALQQLSNYHLILGCASRQLSCGCINQLMNLEPLSSRVVVPILCNRPPQSHPSGQWSLVFQDQRDCQYLSCGTVSNLISELVWPIVMCN